MKRITTLLLFIAIVVGLVGCKDKPKILGAGITTRPDTLWFYDSATRLQATTSGIGLRIEVEPAFEFINGQFRAIKKDTIPRKDSLVEVLRINRETHAPAVGIGKKIDFTKIYTDTVSGKWDSNFLYIIGSPITNSTGVVEWGGVLDSARFTTLHYEVSIYDSIGLAVAEVDDSTLTVLDSLRAIKALIHELKRAYNYKKQ